MAKIYILSVGVKPSELADEISINRVDDFHNHTYQVSFCVLDADLNSVNPRGVIAFIAEKVKQEIINRFIKY